MGCRIEKSGKKSHDSGPKFNDSTECHNNVFTDDEQGNRGEVGQELYRRCHKTNGQGRRFPSCRYFVLVLFCCGGLESLNLLLLNNK